MELKEYIEKVESDTIFKMERRLIEAKDRLKFLADHATFSPVEVRQNSSVFMWHHRMPAIFEEHKLIVSEKRNQYEDALKVSFTFIFKWYDPCTPGWKQHQLYCSFECVQSWIQSCSCLISCFIMWYKRILNSSVCKFVLGSVNPVLKPVFVVLIFSQLNISNWISAHLQNCMIRSLFMGSTKLNVCWKTGFTTSKFPRVVPCFYNVFGFHINNRVIMSFKSLKWSFVFHHQQLSWRRPA